VDPRRRVLAEGRISAPADPFRAKPPKFASKKSKKGLKRY